MWQSYFQRATIDETLALLAKYGPDARLINGGTDLIIEIERRVRAPAIVIDISRIADLDEIRLVDGVFHVGPRLRTIRRWPHRCCAAAVFPWCRPAGA